MIKLEEIEFLKDYGVRIGPYIYSVICGEEEINNLQEKDAKLKGWLGWTSFKDQTMVVIPSQASLAFKSTLLHEIVHGIWDAAGLTSGRKEEEIVSVLAPMLLQVMRYNPEIIKFLMEEIKN